MNSQGKVSAYSRSSSGRGISNGGRENRKGVDLLRAHYRSGQGG